MEKLKVIKIGGNVIDNPDALESFLEAFAAVPGAKILVHGGGAIASRTLKKMGIEPVMIEGRRVTDADTLQVVTAVYAGLINKTIVATLQKYNCNAIGLSGADGNALTSEKRPATPIDYGFVGDVKAVNSSTFCTLLSAGMVPVVCAINHDGNGTLLNTNADTIASSVAVAMSGIYETELILCFEKDGVLMDKDDDGSVIPEIDRQLFEQLKNEGKVNAGMLPKLKNAFDAIDAGVGKVIIKNSARLSDGSGTTIR
ncbi:MAG: acetylglutamate kinase [Bacteroidales bacterium]|nr:acetylglutamate kinase [Bacteroidales bacterium]